MVKVLKKYFYNIRGTAAVEFAFVLPVFLYLVFGSIEFGYVFFANSALKYGATYGARYAFVHPTASNATIRTQALSAITFPSTVINYTVTGAGGAAVNIDGTFTYNFYVLPVDPITLTVHVHQVLPLS